MEEQKKREKKSKKQKNQKHSDLNDEKVCMDQENGKNEVESIVEEQEPSINENNVIEDQSNSNEYEDEEGDQYGEEDEDEEERQRLYEEAKAYREAKERRGVIYMSRIPPFMKPNKARSIFEQYGEVTRLYLAEENPEFRKKRKEHGGNGSKQFREGWIEFADKRIARQVAESLNNTPMSGRKGDYYHDDLWNLKYLKGFKWEFLTEKMAYEKRIRDSKLRAALRQSKKEVEEMRELIEKSEVEQQIQNRKRQRNSVSEGALDSTAAEVSSHKKSRKAFHQAKPIATEYDDSEKKIHSKLLQKIFHH